MNRGRKAAVNLLSLGKIGDIPCIEIETLD